MRITVIKKLDSAAGCMRFEELADAGDVPWGERVGTVDGTPGYWVGGTFYHAGMTLPSGDEIEWVRDYEAPSYITGRLSDAGTFVSDTGACYRVGGLNNPVLVPDDDLNRDYLKAHPGTQLTSIGLSRL